MTDTPYIAKATFLLHDDETGQQDRVTAETFYSKAEEKHVFQWLWQGPKDQYSQLNGFLDGPLTQEQFDSAATEANARLALQQLKADFQLNNPTLNLVQ